ncbi:MAG: hypothetical protein NC110_05135 [Ruminococcus sp.]|nr:hypothetical protein [Ruminococcus sp.]
MAKLKDIDKKAAEKGSALVTLWQFVKFIVVSLLACIVQFALLNILAKIPAIHNLYDTDFQWFVFKYLKEDGGLGYFIAFNTANIVAQIVAFFVNKDKTFDSDANVAVTLPIYIVFTVALICFSAWLSPTIFGWLVGKQLNETLALNIATAVCSTLQFFLYFPVDKLLMSNKKKNGEKKEEAEA